MTAATSGCTRRGAIALAAAAAAAGPARAAQGPEAAYRAAREQQALAESWGDQPYGAVVMLDGAIVGLGPSRVVQRGDPEAHAEREAIGDALRRLGCADLAGAVLVGTSPPCARCREAAVRAGIRRALWGPRLEPIELGR